MVLRFAAINICQRCISKKLLQLQNLSLKAAVFMLFLQPFSGIIHLLRSITRCHQQQESCACAYGRAASRNLLVAAFAVAARWGRGAALAKACKMKHQKKCGQQ